jgi:hypothetical protein
MRMSSRLPRGFGFDPAGLGAVAPRRPPLLSRSPAATGAASSLARHPADDRPVPTFWIGKDGREADEVTEGEGSRSPGSMLMTTACIGIGLAALAFLLDLPLS